MTASTPRGRKAKGREFQKEVTTKIAEALGLVEETSDAPGDLRHTIMSEAGADVFPTSEVGRKKFPFSVECKRQESISVWAAIAQAEKNAKKGTSAMVVFARNRSKRYAIVELDTVLDIIRRQQ